MRAALNGIPGGLPAATVASLLLLGLVATLALWRPAFLENQLEGRLVDWRFRVRNGLRPPVVPPGVVLVAVDDPSVARYGRWPWSRIRIAELVEKVVRGRPRAIGVDLSLTDPESPWADARLAEALSSARGRVATGVPVRFGATFAGELPAPLQRASIGRVEGPASPRPPEAEAALMPPEPIASASDFGHTHYLPDSRGRLAGEQLYLRLGPALIPSLALQTARVAADPPGAARVRGDGKVELAGAVIPADEGGRLLVNYYGREGTFPRYSAGSILSGETPPQILEGAVVLLGTVGIATYDLVATPFGEGLPVLEKHATVVANILGKDFLRDAPPAVDALVVLVAGAAILLLGRRRRAAVRLLILVGLGAALVGANFALFVHGWRLALSYPLLLLAVQGGLTVGGRFLAEERGARRMRRMFSSYVSERVVDQLIADPEMARLGGERRELTILFSDIRGFTGFSEMHPPEEVVRTLNEYLGAMAEVILRWEGTIDKFVGDAILAFWNAPLPQPDHAERALRCALEMSARLDRLNRDWVASNRPPFEAGIGLATGQVLVGNVGMEGRKMDYTVIGDQVNLCSRIEGLTKRYASRILVTAGTIEQLRPLFSRGAFGHLVIEGLGPVAVRGKQEPVRISRVEPRPHGEPAKIEALGPA